MYRLTDNFKQFIEINCINCSYDSLRKEFPLFRGVTLKG